MGWLRGFLFLCAWGSFWFGFLLGFWQGGEGMFLVFWMVDWLVVFGLVLLRVFLVDLFCYLIVSN